MKSEQYPPIADPVVPPVNLPLRPKTMDLSLTGRCNLGCRYCFYNDEMVALDDLSTDRWLSFFHELGELAVQSVALSGGEIFTRPDLFELLDGLIANKMRYSILTNGTLITDKTVTAFDTGKRRLRLDSIQVSIDGSTADIHNKSRPPESFHKAVRGLRLLVEAGFPATVRVTINHHNVDDLESIAAFLLDDIGLAGFSTNEVDFMGTARCGGQNIALTKTERKRASNILISLNEKYGNRITASAGPLAIENQFKEIETALSNGQTSLTGRGTLSCCGGVFNKMAILHDGTIVPCNMLPTLTMGTIGKTSLQEAWLHHPSINAVRQRQTIPINMLPTCTDCDYSGFCTGGCPATTMAKTGKLHGIDPATCYREYCQGETL